MRRRIVAAIVVPAHQFLVHLLGMDRKLGHEAGQEIPDVRGRELVAHHRVPIVEERVDVAGNVQGAVEVCLEERIDRQGAARVTSGQGGVVENDVLREVGHFVTSLVQGERGFVPRTHRSRAAARPSSLLVSDLLVGTTQGAISFPTQRSKFGTQERQA
jgi:hypothetical protein